MSEHKESERTEELVSIDRVGETRCSLLEALRAVGGEGNTSEALQATDAEVSEGSRGYHFRWLESEGLIQEVDREEVTHGGSDVIVWSLTDAGEQLLEAIDEERGREGRPKTIEGLNDRIDKLESENEYLETRLGKVETFVNKFARVVDEHEKELGVVDEGDLTEYDEQLSEYDEKLERLEQSD